MDKYNTYKELVEYDEKFICSVRGLDYPLNRRDRNACEVKFVKLFRLAQIYNDGLTGKIIRFFLKKKAIKYGINIDGKSNIGKGLIIGHFGNIVINPHAKIGDHICIANGVVIGRDMRGKRAGVPTIGSSVCINSNSVIVGNITIGDDVLIAPCTFVNFDVPSHSIVIGNPAKIIHRDHATEGFI